MTLWRGTRLWFFFFQAEDGIRDLTVTGVQTCALPIFVVFGVRHGAFERLDEEAGGLARHEREEVDRLVDGATLDEARDFADLLGRSEERRVGEECRSRGAPYH